MQQPSAKQVTTIEAVDCLASKIEALSKSQSISLSPISHPNPIESQSKNSEFDTTSRTDTRSVNWLALIFLIWIVGFSFQLLRMGIALASIHRIVGKSLPIETSEIASCTQWNCRTDLSGVRFAQSEEIEVPITTGVFFAKILLPSNTMQRSSEELRMILLHELAHVQRKDLLWQVVIAVVSSVYWFQPLVWLANGLVGREREQACDDLVICKGESQVRYACMLLDFASQMSRRGPDWVGSVPAVQKPIEYRVESILSPTVSREPFGRLARKCLFVTAVGLVFVIGGIRPFEPVANAAPTPPKTIQDSESSSDENPKIALPYVLKGLVTDAAGEPLMNAKIEVEYCTWKSDHTKVPSARIVHRSWSTMSNAKGEYSIDTSGLDASGIDPKAYKLNFLGWVYSEGHVSQMLTASGRYVLGKGKLPPQRLPRGRVITGQVVSAKANSEGKTRVKNAIVRLSDSSFWQSKSIRCEPDGSFEVTIPEVGEVEILAVADGLAAKRVYATKDSTVGEIALEEGTVVKGKVLGEDGQPLSGVVVAIEQSQFHTLDKLHRNGRLKPSSAVKTAMDGSFRLPPHRELSVVMVAASWRAHDAPDGFVNIFSDQKPPIIAPQEVELDGNKEYELILRAKKPILVSGTVRWPNGKPAKGVQLTASIMAGSQGRNGDVVETNAEGKYTLQYPANSKFAHMSCLGLRNADDKYFYADPDNKIEMGSKRLQSMSLTDLSKDLTRVDWKLVPKEPFAVSTPKPARKVSIKNKAAESAFSEISSRWHRTPADEKDYQELLRELFRFEKKYRGESAAVNALQLVIKRTERSTNSNGDQERAVELLKEHYLDHSEIDLCMRSMIYGLPSSEIENFFLLVAEKNSLDRVKASALFCHAMYLSEQLELQTYLARYDWDVLKMGDLAEETRTHFIGVMKVVKRQDVEALRAEIRNLASKLKAQYGEIKQRIFLSYVNGFRAHPHQPTDKSTVKTFGELADRILFELDSLVEGNEVPDFDGVDPEGRKFSLSDHRGKVVLIMFSADWCGPCKALYPENRELVKKFKDRPFQLISVMGDHEQDTVAKAVTDGDINWLTTWDGFGGPIASKWNVSSWPKIFIIDHKGIIRATETVSKEREAQIARLIKEAEGDQKGEGQ
ncbi:MAG: M56 family metallopeptidase [Mariniblastus sp.]